jgi:hypothetical protein
MKKILMVILSGILILGMVGMASAAKIEYTDTALGAGRHQLTFDVFNDSGSGFNINWFSIYFGQTSVGLNFADWDKFSNFSPNSFGVGLEPQPAGWLSYSFEPSAISNPGQFNSDLFSVMGITPGNHLGGFTVSFNMVAPASYDHLYYKVGNFDPASGGYVDQGTGYTEKHQGIPGVPEPGTMALLLAGLSGLAFIRKKMGQA